jgi:SAM-dependent methyltransferase
MRSYITTRLGTLGRINEAWNLYVNHTRHVKENVRGLLQQARDSDAKIGSLLGESVTGRRMLEIGPGQQLVQLAYFAMRNEVIGIDLDVILQDMNLNGCIRMAKKNGWMRTCKTIGRKMARIDRRMRAELGHELGIRTMPALRVLEMDAGKMDFPDNQFDVVFSRAVFEHLADPASVISEIRRVLKPGGVMFVALHLFTSDSGCHDTRIFVGQRAALPFWAHLRPEHHQEVRSNSYLNRLRLADWLRIFESKMPGSKVLPLCDAGSVERQELSKLRSQGQLMNYSDEELLTVTLEASWQKPLKADASP